MAGRQRAEALRAWARENLDEADPRLLQKLYEEARRRWGDHSRQKAISNFSKRAYIMIRYGGGGEPGCSGRN